MEAVEAALEAVTGYEPPERVGVRERYTAWAGGRNDEGMGFIAGSAESRHGETAAILFALHVLGDDSREYARHCRKIKDWAYTRAAQFAITKPRINGFRLDWAHQAARDGICDTVWGHQRGTGLDARAEQFRISRRQYQRVRDHVKDSAGELLGAFEARLSVLNDLDRQD